MTLKEWYDSNSGWLGLVGLAIGLIAIIVTIIIYQKQKTPKILGYDRIDVRSLLDARLLNRGKIAVTIDGRDIEEPHLMSFRILNAGKSDISIDDVSNKSIKLHRPLSSRIEQAGARNCSNDFDLKTVDVQLHEHNDTDISFEFLNPGEWFEIQFVTQGRPQGFTLTARVKGMSNNIRELDSPAMRASQRKLFFRFSVAGLAFSCIILILIAAGFLSHTVVTFLDIPVSAIVATQIFLLSRRLRQEY